MPRSPKQPSLQVFWQKFCMHLSSPLHAACSTHLTLLYFNTLIYGPPHYVAFSIFLLLLLSGPIVLFSALLSDTFNVCFSLNVRHQVSHSHRTAGEIIFLKVLIFTYSKTSI
jgi:hypothetical protein